ncbi:MAG: hypothetical protein WAV02_02885 [Stellaceae bacterium]
MRQVVTLVLSAALALTLQPAFAQSPGAATMPPGTQNPALVQQPRLIPPPGGPLSPPATQPSGYQPGPQPESAQPGPQPSNFQPGPTPDQPAPSALIGPGDTGGLCECLINHDPNLPPYDKTMIHRSCTSTVDACQAACNTGKYYSFVPHAVFSCPGQPEPNGHIAMNFSPMSRLLSRR